MTIYKPFDVVEVPFPFSDLPRSKRRKALVISTREFNKHNRTTILMMITSKTKSYWYNDVKIKQWQKAGLRKPCVTRMKIFTLDNRLIFSKVGQLIKEDQINVINTLRASLGFDLK